MVQVRTAVLRSAGRLHASQGRPTPQAAALTIPALPAARASIQASTEPQSAICAKKVTSLPRTVLQSVCLVQQVMLKRRLGQASVRSAGTTLGVSLFVVFVQLVTSRPT